MTVVGQPGQRQRLRVVLFVGKDVRDGGLEGRREAGGCRLQNEDQQVDLPDLGDEGQAQRDGRSHEVQRHEQRAPREPVGEGLRDRRDPRVGQHLDGQRRPEHRACIRAGQLVGQQAERHRHQAGADERDHLGGEQVAVGAVIQDGEHRTASEQFGQRLHFGQNGVLVMGQAVVDVVVDQDALGRRHRAFHRRELAGDVEAGFSPFDHPDDVPQMPLGALEPLHQVGMGGVLMHVFHAEIISPQGGYCHWMLDQRLLARRGEWSPSQAKAIARSGIPAVRQRAQGPAVLFPDLRLHGRGGRRRRAVGLAGLAGRRGPHADRRRGARTGLRSIPVRPPRGRQQAHLRLPALRGHRRFPERRDPVRDRRLDRLRGVGAAAGAARDPGRPDDDRRRARPAGERARAVDHDPRRDRSRQREGGHPARDGRPARLGRRHRRGAGDPLHRLGAHRSHPVGPGRGADPAQRMEAARQVDPHPAGRRAGGCFAGEGGARPDGRRAGPGGRQPRSRVAAHLRAHDGHAARSPQRGRGSTRRGQARRSGASRAIQHRTRHGRDRLELGHRRERLQLAAHVGASGPQRPRSQRS
ncbi:UNVERIFIED_CONTAM: hypothetical protein NCL1_39267 [Trichonephila clavipes]